MELRRITPIELLEIIDEHEKWTKNNIQGKKADLSGVDVSGIDLSGKRLSGIKFNGANLSGANLSASDLSYAEMEGANLQEALLDQVVLTSAKLKGANLRSASLDRATLDSVILDEANISYALCQNASFNRAQLIKTTAVKTILINTRICDAFLGSVNFRGVNLKGAILKRTRMLDCNINNSILDEANLEGAFLSGSDLTGASARGTNFTNTDLTGVIFNSAILASAVFADTKGLVAEQLAGTDITSAKLPGDIHDFAALKNIEEASRNSKKLFFSLIIGYVYSLLTIATTTDGALITNTNTSKLPILNAEIPLGWFYWITPLLLLGLYSYFHINLQRIWDLLADLPAIFPDGRPIYKRIYPWIITGISSAHFQLLRQNRPPLSRIQGFVSILFAWYLLPILFVIFWLRYLRAWDWPGTLLHIGLAGVSLCLAIYLHLLAIDTLSGRLKRDRKIIRVVGLKRLATSLSFAIILMAIITTFSVAPINNPFKYVGTDLRGANFEWMDFHGEVLCFADFRGANFHGADLRSTDLFGANLRGANLADALLDSANFQYADLRDAKGLPQDILREQYRNSFLAFYSQPLENRLNPASHNEDIRKKDFSKRNLQLANFDDADLSGFNFQGADFHHTNFAHANLENADFRKTNLCNTIGIKPEQLKLAIIDSTTILPAELKIVLKNP